MIDLHDKEVIKSMDFSYQKGKEHRTKEIIERIRYLDISPVMREYIIQQIQNLDVSSTVGGTNGKRKN